MIFQRKRTQLESILKSIELVRAGKLMAHPHFLEVDISDLLKICNGCGAAGKIDVVPDTILGLWVGPNCNLHDFWYHVGMDNDDKAQADVEMLVNNLRAIEACSVWALKPPRRLMALTYYGTVVDVGGRAFWKGKETLL